MGSKYNIQSECLSVMYLTVFIFSQVLLLNVLGVLQFPALSDEPKKASHSQSHVAAQIHSRQH